MWDRMTVEQRKENEPFFVAYHNNMAKSIDKYDRDESIPIPEYIADAFECAILDKKPLARYSGAPGLGARFKRVLLKTVPFISSYYTKRFYNENVLCTSAV